MRKIAKQKYSYVVDLSTIETFEDIAPMWAFAKHKAGLALTNDELIEICAYTYREVGPKVIVVQTCECECKKQPWYKRFWNWLTRKK